MSSETADVADEVVDRATPVTTALVTVDPLLKIQAGLEALAAAAPKLDLTTKSGEKALREYRAQCVSLRSSVDAAYETVNRPMLNAQRRARELVADIKAAIGNVEGPVDAAIKAEEAKREAQREARVAAEQQRIDAIRRRMLDAFTTRFMKVSAGTVADITACIVQIEATPGEAFEDLQLEAETMKGICLDRLRVMHAAAVTHERQQAARLAEQAQQEAEAEERRKAEAAEREAQRRALKLQEDDLRLFLETNIRAGSPLPDTPDECLAEAVRLDQLGPTPTLEGDHRRRAEEGRLDRIAGLRVKAERLRQSAENDRLRAENAKLAAEKAERERAEAAERSIREAQERAHRELQDRLAREAAEHQERLARERREREEEARAAERAALDRMQRAAPQMLAALHAAHPIVYAARAPIGPYNAPEAVEALALIDAAIAAATDEMPT